MTRRDFLAGSAAVAIQEDKLSAAVRLIEEQTASGVVSAATLLVRGDSTNCLRSFGKAADPQAVFLLASITKPMTVSAVMTLADRKQISLTDPVHRFIPEFHGAGRERVLVRHLMTHTSGLPDMLPENEDLRKRHAPLSEFVAAACRTPLLFPPGTQVRYQSTGILLLAEMAQRITKQIFPLFIAEHVFRPLGMGNTSLGLGGRAITQTMQCQVDQANNWDWNSPYWRNLASPWGGAHSTAEDVAKFLEYFARPDGRMVNPETAAEMRIDQTGGLTPPWGLGWMLNHGEFGKACSPPTYGHGGSTGTLCWLDPVNKRTFVLLTTKPSIHSDKTLLRPVSDLVSLAG